MTLEEFKIIREREGDEYLFTYRGFSCEIRRHTNLWHLCGYIDIPLDSRYYRGEDYDDYVFINQFPTYGRIRSNTEGTFYRVGFDCAHHHQLCPATLIMNKSSDHVYRTKEDCIEMIQDTIDYWIEQSE